MIRLRIKELMERCNEGRPREERINMESVAAAIGVPRSTLAVMSTFNRKPVTNTANFEALCRFFHQHLPGFEVRDLLEFEPPLDETDTVVVDELYPERAARRNR